MLDAWDSLILPFKLKILRFLLLTLWSCLAGDGTLQTAAAAKPVPKSNGGDGHFGLRGEEPTRQASARSVTDRQSEVCSPSSPAEDSVLQLHIERAK